MRGQKAEMKEFAHNKTAVRTGAEMWTQVPFPRTQSEAHTTGYTDCNTEPPEVPLLLT